MSTELSQNGKSGSAWLLIGLSAIILITALLLFQRVQLVGFDRGVAGSLGLVEISREAGANTSVFRGGYSLDVEKYGLRIFPLAREYPEGSVEGAIPFGLRTSDLQAKIRDIPSLVVLPKWKRQMWQQRRAAPELILHEGTGSALFWLRSLLENAEFQNKEGWQDFEWNEYSRLSIYQPQLFSSEHCAPVIGDARAMLIGLCQQEDGASFFLLSDPDLMNNHGLTQGQNAAVAPVLLAHFSQGDQMLLDLSDRYWGRADQYASDPIQKSWADLAPFFAGRFAMLWIGLLAIVSLALWRGLVREAPAKSIYARGPGATRSVALDARASLMLRSNKLLPLLKGYAQARISAAAVRLFGRRAAKGRERQLLFRAVRLRNSDAAVELASLMRELDALEAPLSQEEMQEIVIKFDGYLSEVKDES